MKEEFDIEDHMYLKAIAEYKKYIKDLPFRDKYKAIYEHNYNEAITYFRNKTINCILND
jgi:hypothetical protein